jgi:hypothetical protein
MLRAERPSPHRGVDERAEPRLAFLLYLNRSGSTLLAHYLSTVAEIGVSIEGDIPDGISLPALDVHDAPSLEAALDRLYRQGKFASWSIDRAALRRRLSGRAFPIPFREVLAAALAEYFGDRERSVFVYKRGPYANHVRALVDAFPDARFIALIRDPRGIYSSQSTKGMAYNPLLFARTFNRFEDTVADFRNDPRFFVVRYEDFVSRPEGHLDALCAFLGIAHPTRVEASYTSRIPPSQRHLHTRIERGADSAIAAEWEARLGRPSVVCLEHLCRDGMRRWGYPARSASPSELRGALWTALFWLHQAAMRPSRALRARLRQRAAT